MTTVSDRFFAKVVPAGDGSGCLLWKAAVSTEGYGRFYHNGKNHQAHRWLLERGLGREIPRNLDVDHLCRNRACVSPQHLEIVTRSENIRRGRLGDVTRARAALITHCPQGHPYDESNTLVLHRKSGGTKRLCRACSRARHKRIYGTGAAYMRERRARQKAEKLAAKEGC